MKKLLFISLICTLISSCNDNLDEITWHSNENEMASRSITTEVSPMFDWDDTTHISLYNISRPVILPWYSGAEASIPSFILDSYKESDGWKLVYNTCSPSLLMQDGKYYLIFYNIFSGRLRGYVYNKNNVTSGDITFWQLTFDNQTTLLNDLTPNTTPGTIPVDERILSVSNLSVNPTKALSRGWNAFEADLLTYDPNMSNKNIALTISAYDVDRSEITLEGNINLESSGTMLTTTTISSLTSPNVLTKAVSLLGDSATVKINDMFEHNNESTTRNALLGMAVGEIIKAGGNFLVNKFFGRSSTQTIKSESEIKISTNGTFKADGEIISQQQSNISPLSRLMLPGSTPTPEDIFMPSYDEPLGVWYLEQAPEVRHNAITWFFTTEPLGTGNEYIGYQGTKDFYTLDQSSIHVTLNPAVLPYIDKYEVSAKFLEVRKIAHKPSKTAQAPIMVDGVGQGSVSYCPISFDSEFFSAPDSLLVRFSDSNSFTTDYVQVTPYGLKVSLNELSQVLGKPIQTTSTSLPNSVVRVSVTLYPKAPYNTDPIVTTRTFAPQFEEVGTNAAAMECIQYKDGEFTMGMTQQEAGRMAIPEEVYQECARIVDELNDK